MGEKGTGWSLRGGGGVIDPTIATRKGNGIQEDEEKKT